MTREQEVRGWARGLGAHPTDVQVRVIVGMAQRGRQECRRKGEIFTALDVYQIFKRSGAF